MRFAPWLRDDSAVPHRMRAQPLDRWSRVRQSVTVHVLGNQTFGTSAYPALLVLSLPQVRSAPSWYPRAMRRRGAAGQPPCPARRTAACTGCGRGGGLPCRCQAGRPSGSHVARCDAAGCLLCPALPCPSATPAWGLMNNSVKHAGSANDAMAARVPATCSSPAAPAACERC